MRKRARFSTGATSPMFRKWGMALALFAMLLNAFASFTCTYRLPGTGETDPMADAAAQAAAALGEPLIICTPAGLRVIDASQSTGSGTPDDSSSPLCGYCLLQAVAATLSPPSSATVSTSPEGWVRVLSSPRSRSRASPPTSAIPRPARHRWPHKLSSPEETWSPASVRAPPGADAGRPSFVCGADCAATGEVCLHA